MHITVFLQCDVMHLQYLLSVGVRIDLMANLPQESADQPSAGWSNDGWSGVILSVWLI